MGERGLLGVRVVRESIATIGNAEGIFEVPAQSLSSASTDVNPRPTACLGARLGLTSTARKGPTIFFIKEQENETNFAAPNRGHARVVFENRTCTTDIGSSRFPETSITAQSLLKWGTRR